MYYHIYYIIKTIYYTIYFDNLSYQYVKNNLKNEFVSKLIIWNINLSAHFVI